MQDKCSAYVLLETPQADEAARLLEEKGVTETERVNGQIKVFDDIPKEDIAKWMYEGKILLTLLLKHEESLENYYMHLLGRGEK